MPDSFDDDFLQADLGDVRRNRSLLRLAAKLADAPALSISAACGSWAEANSAFRLLHSPQTTPAAIFAPHREALVARAAAFARVLVIQDTTELDFTSMKAMQGCGPLNSLSRKGHHPARPRATREEAAGGDILGRARRGTRPATRRRPRALAAAHEHAGDDAGSRPAHPRAVSAAVGH